MDEWMNGWKGGREGGEGRGGEGRGREQKDIINTVH